ncbi:MAG: hypothetical protein JO112_16355, partial [Planctomycetes bacterium]|nr:hypothetical protein [Planctomycetota bacterium]
MRWVLPALVASAFLTLPAQAGELRNYEDAALHAVQFVDRNEGWAVGDEGVVWHTMDGGLLWEKQPTGVRASLRSLHFLNPYTGWVVGREELPHGAGSVGVLLFTEDGGLTWRQAGLDAFPGLNYVRFLDNTKGFVAGDGTDQFPTGVLATVDSGRTWRPVQGSRRPSWLTGDFSDGQNGMLAGTWNRLGSLHQGALTDVEVSLLDRRNLTGLQRLGQRGLAVGQGGLVLVSDNPGDRWTPADIKLTTEVRAAWDFHAVHGLGDHVWVGGRPGSAILHSKDRGQTWEVLRTGQPLPLHGLFFIDPEHGWAVGEFGTILATADGGKTWSVQHRCGQRAAVLFLQAGSGLVPLDTLAYLGGQESYLATAVRVNCPDGESAAPAQALTEQRFAAAVRQVGGATGELLWQFPVPEHLAHASQAELLKTWDRWHADRAAEALLRQMVLALRMWRPDVVVIPAPDERVAGSPAEALVAEAVRAAFKQAADPAA